MVIGVHEIEDLDLPRRLSDRVAWVLTRPDLDRALADGGRVFDRVMSQLEQDLDRAFSESDDRARLEVHRALTLLYEDSIGAPRPDRGWNQYHPFVMRIRRDIEKAWEAFERDRIGVYEREVPTGSEDFVVFMKDFCAEHSLARHRLFDFLEKEADQTQMIEFFLHERTLALHFYDLVVLSLLGAQDETRHELAENFWDEMGEGEDQNRHTEVYRRLLRSTGKDVKGELTARALNEKLGWPGFAGYNLFLFFGLHRRNYFRFQSALGVAEFMDPEQYRRIISGCRRIGLDDPEILAYYAGHAEMDLGHGEGWFRNVLAPMVGKHPEVRQDVVVGALMRVQTASDYYDYLYRKLSGHSDEELPSRAAAG